jgi:hypothetical protein
MAGFDSFAPPNIFLDCRQKAAPRTPAALTMADQQPGAVPAAAEPAAAASSTQTLENLHEDPVTGEKVSKSERKKTISTIPSSR